MNFFSVLFEVCASERQRQKYDSWCHLFTTRLRKRAKLLIFNINLCTFEANLFSYFVHVIPLNDVIKQRVKIIEECDNLQEMTRWEVTVWFHSTWGQRKLIDHAITLRTMKHQPLQSNRKTPPKTNTILKWPTTCDQATRQNKRTSLVQSPFITST